MPTHHPLVFLAGLLAALFGALLAPAAAMAQGSRVVRGTVLGSGDGAPLGNARVHEVGRDSVFARTSERGRFVLSVREGPVRLAVTRLGFAPDTLVVAATVAEVMFQLREAPLELDPLAVNSSGSYSAASSSSIRELDLALRPVASAQALLPLVPGLFIAQHAGGGKAEQIFLRGFDADHGTDVAITVDGVPVNVVSHAHGQGYADLHFVMPEIVEQLDVRKGPYAAQDGDLATAGTVDYRTKDRVLGVGEARAGTYGSARVMTLVPFGGDATRTGGYIGGSWQTTEGPFLAPQDFGSANGVLRLTTPVGAGARFTLSASGYGGSWDASGQIPQRAVTAGTLDRFGAVDATEGGTTHRYDVSAALGGDSKDGAQWSARAYATNYYLNLFSNFTFFLADSVNGDGIEQRDSRWVYGATGSYTRPTRYGSLPGSLAAGAGFRIDNAEVGLFDQVQRSRLGTTVASLIDQQNWFLWARQDLAMSRRVMLQVGLRTDLFDARVRADPGHPIQAEGLPEGGRTLVRVSPKLNVSYAAGATTTLYANAGLGFHSNDARDMVQAAAGQEVLPAALGAELGLRQSWRGGTVAVAFWGLDLQSELVFVGDEGVTEAVGPSRRVGIDVEGRQQLAAWLWLDLDLNLTRGWLKEEPADANDIPLAPRFTLVAGLTARDLGRVSGGARVRHINDRPAIEDASITALGYTIVQLFGTYDVGRGQVFVSVDNLLDAEWNEAQFATTSRLAGEPNGGYTDLNFTPGAPRTFLAGARYFF